MILQVPYLSQQKIETGDQHQWCGIACLGMVLGFYLRENAPSLETLVQNFGTKLQNSGFAHKDIINFARVYGFRGWRKSWWAEPGNQYMLSKFRLEGETDEDLADWSESNINEGMYTIERSLQQKQPVIVSVNPEFSPSKSTHLVVVVGYENGYLTIHDPYLKGANFNIGEAGFRKYWLRQAIFLVPPTATE